MIHNVTVKYKQNVS